jgi:autotransporter-associated beta strand protein
MHFSPHLLAPVAGCLFLASTASHAASCHGFGFSGACSGESGTSGVLTIAGGGASAHGTEEVSGGTLSLWKTGDVIRSDSGSLVLSGVHTYTGEVILSTGSLSSFRDSLGSLPISSGTIPLTGDSPATDWASGSQMELSSNSFLDPTSLSGGSLFVTGGQQVTGWTVVPEPSGAMLPIVGGNLSADVTKVPRNRIAGWGAVRLSSAHAPPSGTADPACCIDPCGHRRADAAPL